MLRHDIILHTVRNKGERVVYKSKGNCSWERVKKKEKVSKTQCTQINIEHI